ncbi:MAG: SCO family protein [Hydrogenophaga sp.]|uniref:SCO family protein n=1 Tax=Hydrogenophaga sp. TaxID=1904254 RepID=UPI00271F7253|nr:SCO family protein [Hydrogenophaga sp.]MDO9146310.1 SCO family protein [Hydrogenophaga sp.]MDO9604679.1 SCO family protein [Hydrogenophaga sp.]MDP2163919.1 SCO family protein [Hydrogenophaga sp.]MDP3478082.1 SCO family protein [Hydrogenophaga sp.]
MTVFALVRRSLLLAFLLALGACGENKPAFTGIDITGADYATGFSLTDHNGQPRTLADFKGKAVVVFFGFTQCPDVCPTSMGELAEARRLLGTDGERLQGLFISIDPERDTPEIMKEYMANFDPSFLALYAAPEALPALGKSYRIYYKKVPGSTPTSYTLDHSAGSYVYDPSGRIRLYHRYGSSAQALADDVKLLLNE